MSLTKSIEVNGINYFTLNLPGKPMDGFPVGKNTEMKQHEADLIAQGIIDSLNDEGDLSLQEA